MRPVVVGVDGSEQSIGALGRAKQFASVADVPLHVVYCADFTPAVLHLPDGVTVNTRDLAEQSRTEVWEKLEPHLGHDGELKRVDLEGYPADELVEYCEKVDAEVLVLGTRGRGRLASTVLGSTSMRALEKATCDVLIAK